MSKRDQIEKSVIDGTILDQTRHYNTHYEKHVNVSKKEAMERTLSEISVNSVFSKNVNPEELIQDAILYKAKDIADWMNTAEYYETKEFDVRMDQPVGKGNKFNKYTNIIREYETDTVRVVLQKNPNRPLGFTLLTAYPNTNTPSAVPTNKNLNNIITYTDAYKTADPVGKAYMLYRTDPRNNESISYIKGTTPDDSVMYMEIHTDDPQIKHIIKFKENETSMRTVKIDENRKKISIPSKYTDIRDKSFPDKTFKNFNVRLSSKPIQEEFRKDFPDVSKAVGRAITVIKNSLAKEAGDTYPIRDYTKQKEQKTTEKTRMNHDDIVRKATMISDGIESKSESDNQFQ